MTKYIFEIPFRVVWPPQELLHVSAERVSVSARVREHQLPYGGAAQWSREGRGQWPGQQCESLIGQRTDWVRQAPWQTQSVAAEQEAGLAETRRAHRSHRDARLSDCLCGSPGMCVHWSVSSPLSLFPKSYTFDNNPLVSCGFFGYLVDMGKSIRRI